MACYETISYERTDMIPFALFLTSIFAVIGVIVVLYLACPTARRVIDYLSTPKSQRETEDEAEAATPLRATGS